MYSKKIFYKLCLFAGLTLIAVGLIMNVLDISSSGMTYSKRGASWGTLNGNDTFVIAFVMLALSGMSYVLYKKDLEERERRRSEEEQEMIRKKKKKK